jgi:hypothetical protein
MLLVAGLLACGSGGAAPPRPAGVSARAALAEAQVVADTWAGGAELRWVEGDGIDGKGLALPDRGTWAFHYATSESNLELVVQISPFQMVSEERRVTSPPGFDLGDGTLGSTWLDSGAVLDAVTGAGVAPLQPPITLLLVPTRPPRWVVRSDIGRRWAVNAENGEVLEP